MSCDDEPHKLWHEFTQKVNKLEQRQVPDPVMPAKSIEVKPRPLALPDLPLVTSHIASLDRKYLRRIKNGTVAINKTLDFHGLSSATAKKQLIQAIKNCFLKQQRLILVITGKGLNKQGTLRQNLPLWLNEVEIRSFISGFSSSAVKHGGEGAFYLVLKKNKASNLDTNFLF